MLCMWCWRRKGYGLWTSLVLFGLILGCNERLVFSTGFAGEGWLYSTATVPRNIWMETHLCAANSCNQDKQVITLMTIKGALNNPWPLMTSVGNQQELQQLQLQTVKPNIIKFGDFLIVGQVIICYIQYIVLLHQYYWCMCHNIAFKWHQGGDDHKFWMKKLAVEVKAP